MLQFEIKIQQFFAKSKNFKALQTTVKYFNNKKTTKVFKYNIFK